MAKKISQLDAASSVTSADTFVCVQSSTTKKVAGTALLTMTDASSILVNKLRVVGSFASPVSITAVGGISISGYQRELQFIVSNGGDVIVSANPQIAAGTIVGQELILVGTHNTNRVTVVDGTGIKVNGAITFAEYTVAYLVWTGAIWLQVATGF